MACRPLLVLLVSPPKNFIPFQILVFDHLLSVASLIIGLFVPWSSRIILIDQLINPSPLLTLLSHNNHTLVPIDVITVSITNELLSILSSLTVIMTTTESYDWEARIAIEIIEKTWEEIMMVGLPNTSGVNQKDFLKNSLKQHDEERNADQSIGEIRNSIGSIDNNDSNAMENQTEETKAEQKSCSNESSKLNVFSDAYRIPNEGVDVEGKSASATAKETNDEDLGTIVPTVTESCKPGNEGEKGKANNDDINVDVGSSPTPGVDDESNSECALVSPVSSQEFAATATTTTTTISSPSAMHGIETGLQYLSNTYDSRRIAEVMDNTRCIFPAASKIATAAITGDHNTSNELLQQHQQKQKQPFMTINPSYLHSVTGDELLVAFDEIMAMAFTDSSSDEPCSFILPEEATPASWIDLLRSYTSTDTATSTSTPLQSIPLYILVLCRFQYSLARSYSERSLAQPNHYDQIGDSQPISHESAAQWLTALMTRIHELETMESTEIQRLLSKLASKLPEAGEFVEGDIEDKKYDLEHYLVLPFTVVAERLGKDSALSSDYVDVLKEIDSCIEESLQDDLIASEKDHLAPATVSVCETESAQDGDLVSSEITELPPGNESQIVTNNGFNATSSGSRKTKKKKKKKVCFVDNIVLSRFSLNFGRHIKLKVLRLFRIVRREREVWELLLHRQRLKPSKK
jgi:hypothetical protein